MTNSDQLRKEPNHKPEFDQGDLDTILPQQGDPGDEQPSAEYIPTRLTLDGYDVQLKYRPTRAMSAEHDVIVWVTHPSSERFHELLDEAGELHDRKMKDYGSDNDPFANVRASSDWGMPAWVGAMLRLNDKVKRLQTFARKGELANESAIDSFMDIAVYAIIARVLYEQEEST